MNLKAQGDIPIAGDVVGGNKNVTNIYHYGDKKVRPIPRMAPPAPRVFIGRDEVLRELIAVLKLGEDGAGPIALTALKGMGGIGKTTLAAALANHPEVETALPEGTLWAGLGPEPEVMSLLAEWGAQLGEDFAQFDSPEARSRRLSTLLHDKKALLIVDDVWHAEPARYFLVGGPRCRALITTRDNEIARKLAGHEAVRVETLAHVASLNLLRQLAPKAVDADEKAANELATALDGLPLALTLAGQMLAAEWEAGLGIAGALSELKDREARLKLVGAERRTGLLDVSPSLRAILSMSYDHLPDEETKRAFRFLGTFSGRPFTFKLEAAAYILRKETASFRNWIAKRLGISFLRTRKEIDPNSLRRIISILVQRALVDPMKDGRYSLHTILADLAESLLEENGEAVIIHKAHMNYYLSFAQQNAERNWQTVESEMGQIQRGFCSAHNLGSCTKVFDYRWAMRTFFTRRGLWDRYLDWTEMALYFAQAIKARQIEATLINDIGFIYKNKDQWNEALRYYVLSRQIHDEIGDQEGLALTLNNIGSIYIDQGAWDEALRRLESCLVIYENIGKFNFLATTLDNIGNVYLCKGDWDEALVYFMRGRAIWEKIGDQAGLAVALVCIGSVYERKGSWEEALSYNESGRKILEELGDLVGLAPVLNNMGRIYADKGMYDDALRYYNRSRAISEEIGDRSGLAVTLTNIGRLYLNKGLWEQALECQEQSRKICEDIGYTAVLAEALNNIGRIYAFRGCLGEALTYYDHSRVIREDIGDRTELAVTLSNIGGIYHDIGALDKALEHYERSRAIREEIGDRRGLASSLNNIGGIYHAKGLREKALEYYECSRKIQEEFDDQFGLAATLNNIGGIYLDKGLWNEALRYFENSRAIRESIGDQHGLAQTLCNIGYLHTHQNQLREAEQAFTMAIVIFETLKGPHLDNARKQLDKVRELQRIASQK